MKQLLRTNKTVPIQKFEAGHSGLISISVVVHPSHVLPSAARRRPLGDHLVPIGLPLLLGLQVPSPARMPVSGRCVAMSLCCYVCLSGRATDSIVHCTRERLIGFTLPYGLLAHIDCASNTNESASFRASVCHQWLPAESDEHRHLASHMLLASATATDTLDDEASEASFVSWLTTIADGSPECACQCVALTHSQTD